MGRSAGKEVVIWDVWGERGEREFFTLDVYDGAEECTDVVSGSRVYRGSGSWGGSGELGDIVVDLRILIWILFESCVKW